MEARYKTGLVLSGGGARGFAHLGVIRALNDKGIFPGIVSGTSAGAIVGALYADGYSPDEIMKLMNSKSSFDFFSFTMPRMGFMKISGVDKILRSSLRASRFEDLKIPLVIAATDLNNGKVVYFSEGELIPAIIASASIPVLFLPQEIEGIQYVDGGVLDNLPVMPLEGKCDFLVGSFVNPTGNEEHLTSVIQIAMRTFMLSVSRELNEKAGKFDLLFAPPELKDYKILDPSQAGELFDLGYNITTRQLNQMDISGMIN